MALKFIDGKKIVYDDAEQHPGQSGYGSDYKTSYCVFTPGTQNSDTPGGGGFDNPDPDCFLARSQKYARKGAWSYMAFLRRGPNTQKNLKWSRAELGWLSPSQQNESNEWNWAAISTLVDPSTKLPNNIRYQIAYDHKESPDNRETPFWLGIRNGNYIIAGGQVGGEVNLGPVQKGVWEDWILHRNWLQNGFINFYRNGKLVWSKTGDMRVNSYIARIQHGIYKWALMNNNEGTPNANDEAPITIYMDEIRFGMKGGAATLQDFILDGSVVVPPVVVDPPPVVVPPVTGSINISAGSTTDKYFTGGSVYKTGNKTERFGNFSYTIPVANGKYDVKLTFEEIYHSAANARLFNVNLEGRLVLTNYDIVAKAGGKDKPITETFPVIVTDGSIGIQFITVKDNAKVTGIEIVPSSVAPPVDTTNFYVSSVESTEIVNGNTYKSIIITWKDGTKTELYKKP